MGDVVEREFEFLCCGTQAQLSPIGDMIMAKKKAKKKAAKKKSKKKAKR